MQPNTNADQTTCATVDAYEQNSQVESSGSDEFKWRRLLVSFASGRDWYPVGE